MINLLEQIKSDLTEVRKVRDGVASNLLSTLYAEAGMVGKNASNRESTDEEVIARVKAFIKNINETLKSLPESHAKKDTLEREKELLKKYLPQQMSEETLKEIIKKIGVTHEKSIKSMGKVMGELKAKYGGQYDGKMASNFVKSFLNE